MTRIVQVSSDFPDQDTLPDTCDSGRYVHWMAQCDARCNECTECARWFVAPAVDQQGGFICHLRSARAAYIVSPGDVLGLGKMCQKEIRFDWDRDGLTRRCAGIFETGSDSEQDCSTLCAHDRECELYQFQGGVCIVGKSAQCTGEGGWTGGRKKTSAKEDMKDACNNFQRASELQQSGKFDLDPVLQSAVDMSTSTCFQYICEMSNSDIDCSDDTRHFVQQDVDNSCDSIPAWKVGEWDPICRAGEYCGATGSQFRSVTCSHSEAECEQIEPKPLSERSCTRLHLCEWIAGSWGPCSARTCDEVGTQTRTVSCSGPDGACAARGHGRLASTRACYMSGCDNADNADLDSCADQRRLHSLWINESDISELAEPHVKPSPPPATSRTFKNARKLEEEQVEIPKVLSAQECATLTATAGFCTMASMSSAGPAGFDFQMSVCMNKQLDEIKEETKKANSKLDVLTTTVKDGFDDVNAKLEEQTVQLKGVMKRLATESVDELKAHQVAIGRDVVTELEEDQASSRM